MKRLLSGAPKHVFEYIVNKLKRITSSDSHFLIYSEHLVPNDDLMRASITTFGAIQVHSKYSHVLIFEKPISETLSYEFRCSLLDELLPVLIQLASDPLIKYTYIFFSCFNIKIECY